VRRPIVLTSERGGSLRSNSGFTGSASSSTSIQLVGDLKILEVRNVIYNCKLVDGICTIICI
jgi:hypothetical protein